MATLQVLALDGNKVTLLDSLQSKNVRDTCSVVRLQKMIVLLLLWGCQHQFWSLQVRMGLSCRSKLKRWIRIVFFSIWCHQVHLLPLLDLPLCHGRQLQRRLGQFAFPLLLRLMPHWMWPVQRSHWQLWPQVSLKPGKSFSIVESDILLLFGVARAYVFVSFLFFWYFLSQSHVVSS